MAEKEKGLDIKVAALVAAAVVLMASGYIIFSQESPPVAQPSPAQTQKPLETPAAKLLLAAFDAGTRLQEYEILYVATENGAATNYDLRSDGNLSFVNVSGAFGNLRGYLGGGNESEVVCLTYLDEDKCALVGNDSDASSIAASLRILLPDKKTFIAQKTQIIKLVNVGAISFDSQVEEEEVGGFKTSRISYSLDYRKLTVDQLLSVGVSPSDPALSSISDQKIAYWIDKATGLIVKSRATYKESLIPNTYETDYLKILAGSPSIPAKPSGVIETVSFVAFYSRAEGDYQAKVSCLSLKAGERNTCLKSLAMEKRSWEVCKLIADKTDYEACTLIVAQETNNAVLCGKLEAFHDDCLIAVAGKTGNFDLCRNLKNSSLSSNCSHAASDGMRILAEKEEARRRQLESRECAADTDCAKFGNAQQYCALRNSTKTFGNETTPFNACFRGLACSCKDGFCGFAKNQSFYQCIGDIETLELEKFINSISNQSNSSK